MNMKVKSKIHEANAIQWTGDNLDEVFEFCKSYRMTYNNSVGLTVRKEGKDIYVQELDYLVLTGKGIRILPPKVFDDEYDLVEAQA